MSITLNYNELSAIPTEGIADLLHGIYKKSLLDSLDKLISYAAEELEIDTLPILNILKNLNNNLPAFLTPWSYYIYFKLRSAMMSDSVQSVKNIISNLNIKPIDCFQQQARSVQPAFSESWEQGIFNEEVLASFGKNDYNPLPPCQQQFASLDMEVKKAINLIHIIDAPMATEINSLIATIKLLHNHSTLAATSPKFFGAIYLSIPMGHLKIHQHLVLVDHLVHETSHLYLNSILIHDPLVLNDENARFSSPIRKDSRPMLGIYHAVFVLSRVIRILKMIDQFNLYHDADFLNQCTIKFIKQYEIGFETIKKHGILSDLGQGIFLSTRECSLIY